MANPTAGSQVGRGPRDCHCAIATKRDTEPSGQRKVEGAEIEQVEDLNPKVNPEKDRQTDLGTTTPMGQVV